MKLAGVELKLPSTAENTQFFIYFIFATVLSLAMLGLGFIGHRGVILTMLGALSGFALEGFGFSITKHPAQTIFGMIALYAIAILVTQSVA